MEKLPKIDLDELKEEMELNRQQRREFTKQFARWLKKTPGKEWSVQHNKYFGKAKPQQD